MRLENQPHFLLSVILGIVAFVLVGEKPVFAQQAPYHAWRSTYFSAADVYNPGISGESTARSDDGIPNLMKYALGLTPTQRATAALPKSGIIFVSGTGYLTLTYTQVTGATDINYAMEVSSDLQTWSSTPTTVVSMTPNSGGLTQTVVARDTIPFNSSSRRFARLNVTKPLLGTQYWVSQSAASGGNGSSSKPYQTITAAVNAAKAGDTVTILSGTYYETVSPKSGLSEANPFVIQSAPGAQVTVCGGSAVPLSAWTVYSGTTFASNATYTATVNYDARDLSIKYSRCPLSRWPSSQSQWATIGSWTSSGSTAGTITTTADMNVPSEVINTPGTVLAYIYEKNSNIFYTWPITSIQSTGTSTTIAVSSSSGAFKSNTLLAGDSLILCNHPAFIRDPGDWAYSDLGNGKAQYYFNPGADYSNLSAVQTRCQYQAFGLFNLSNVVIRGLEIAGAASVGITISGCDGVTLQQCTVHDNGGINYNNAGEGIFVSSCSNIAIQGCLITNNTRGIMTSGVDTLYVLQSEICHNDIDGIDLAGNDTIGKPVDANGDLHVTIKQCYIHNHMALDHPDNLQCYSGVSDVMLDSNWISSGGSGMMVQDTYNTYGSLTSTNNVFSGVTTSVFNLGHKTSSNWNFINNTFAFGNPAPILATDLTSNDKVHNNIFFRSFQTYSTNFITPDFDYNYFYAASTPGRIAYGGTAGITFNTVAEIQTATQQEMHSSQGAYPTPLFKNTPLDQAVMTEVSWLPSTTSKIYITFSVTKSSTGFAAGHYVQIDGNNYDVPRQIQTTGADANGTYITINPPLPTRPFRQMLLWDWGSNTNYALDMRPIAGSAALSGGDTGGARGAMLNLTDYANGKFDGTGVRNIPVPTPEIIRSWQTPKLLFPYIGLP